MINIFGAIMKIKKSSISKNLEVLCTLLACVMSPCFNYRLTTPPHTADKPPDLIVEFDPILQEEPV